MCLWLYVQTIAVPEKFDVHSFSFVLPMASPTCRDVSVTCPCPHAMWHARRYLEIQEESRVVQAAKGMACMPESHVILDHDYMVYCDGQHLLVRVTGIQVSSGGGGGEPQVAVAVCVCVCV